jgi:hypothetical protein
MIKQGKDNLQSRCQSPLKLVHSIMNLKIYSYLPRPSQNNLGSKHPSIRGRLRLYTVIGLNKPLNIGQNLGSPLRFEEGEEGMCKLNLCPGETFYTEKCCRKWDSDFGLLGTMEHLCSQGTKWYSSCTWEPGFFLSRSCEGQKLLLPCKWQRKVSDTEIPRVQFQAFNFIYLFWVSFWLGFS